MSSVDEASTPSVIRSEDGTETIDASKLYDELTQENGGDGSNDAEHDHHHDHDHDHDDHDHDHDDEATVGDWVAEIRDKDSGEIVKEVPLLMERHGVTKMNNFNFYTAMQLLDPWESETQGTQVFVVFWYNIGCGLCVDAHEAFVEAARHFRDSLAGPTKKREDDEATSLRPAGTTAPIRFGQYEVDFDDEDDASHVKNLGPGGKPMTSDFPLVTIMYRRLKVNTPLRVATTIKDGFTGPLTSEGILAFMEKHGLGRGALDIETVKTKLETTSKVKLGKVDQPPPTFTDGLLDVE